MDELIGRIVANVGVDRTAAEKAVGIILQFLLKEGPADKVRSLIDKLPGAEAAIASSTSRFRLRRHVWWRRHGGRQPHDVAGLGMGQVQAVTRETIGYSREKVGDETLERDRQRHSRPRPVRLNARRRRTAGKKRGEFDVVSHHPHRGTRCG